MKITLKNADIAKTYNFVEQIKVKGKDALALAKFIKLLRQTLAAASEDEQTLADQFAQKDADGTAKTNPNGNVLLDPTLVTDYKKSHADWLDQEAEIEGGTYVNHIDDVDRILDEYVEKTEIGGSDLEAYLSLHEAFEAAQSTKKGVN
ncbi:DUF1617 family protein [Lacticaseibacillus paracasei]|uniref:Phage protein n=1 Tax=Lacticaseibacillus paracasei NRIC 0644 TaxID=1435038 RepID=A0A0C9PNF6_LACPA|nr:DUF1617 family protein [Lacticaseibacillus paracasei]GAN36481.1 hypothetical protein LC0644_1070 [Lacticaseibacillus paracasei NRIC 0644]GAN39248.1 hypothetical protein LC1917_1125 [Lacticaseibacillus paracasei NRIC 1917]